MEFLADFVFVFSIALSAWFHEGTINTLTLNLTWIFSILVRSFICHMALEKIDFTVCLSQNMHLMILYQGFLWSSPSVS